MTRPISLSNVLSLKTVEKVSIPYRKTRILDLSKWSPAWFREPRPCFPVHLKSVDSDSISSAELSSAVELFRTKAFENAVNRRQNSVML